MFWSLPGIPTDLVDPVESLSAEEVKHRVVTSPTLHEAFVADMEREKRATVIVIEPAARTVKIDGVECGLTRSVRRVLALLQFGRWCDFR